MRGYVECEISSGMFPGEKIVMIDAVDKPGLSMFIQNVYKHLRLSIDDKTFLEVDVLIEGNKVCLINLPVSSIDYDSSRSVAVLTNKLYKKVFIGANLIELKGIKE